MESFDIFQLYKALIIQDKVSLAWKKSAKNRNAHEGIPALNLLQNMFS